MTRDPYLPSPEICDWLLAQEWSEPATVHVTYSSGTGYINDCRCATAVIGRDNDAELMITDDCVKLLKEDQQRRQSKSFGNSAQHGLLPMSVSATGSSGEPAIERIICSSISGGANYVNDMPHTLSLERVTLDATYHATYVQVAPPDAWLPSVSASENDQP